MRGWYSRGYLPHCDEPGRVQFITYRLHDSMPKEVLDAYDEALRRKEIDELERMRKIERYLDKGHGACWLRDPVVAHTTPMAPWSGTRMRPKTRLTTTADMLIAVAMFGLRSASR